MSFIVFSIALLDYVSRQELQVLYANFPGIANVLV